MSVYARCMTHHPNHQENKMIKFRLYIPPVILGFVIVPLLVWPTVIALAVLIFTLTFLAEIIFSFPLLVVRISLQELQLELLVEYALFSV